MDGKPDIWIRTGDEVLFNEEVEIFVLDRIKVGVPSTSKDDMS